MGGAEKDSGCLQMSRQQMQNMQTLPTGGHTGYNVKWDNLGNEVFWKLQQFECFILLGVQFLQRSDKCWENR